MLRQENNRIIFHYDAEELWIEPWGKDAVRVRATKNAVMPANDWALTRQEEPKEAAVSIGEQGAELKNGKLRVHITLGGKITMYNQKGELLLEEYWRNRRVLTDPKCSY